MTETLLLKLAQFIIENAASGVIGNAAYDTLKKWWGSRDNQSFEAIYIDEFIKTVRDLESVLLHFAEKGAKITIEKDLLKRVLTQELPSMPLFVGTAEGLLDALADGLVKEQVISIPGHQLTDLEYKGLILDVLERTWARMNQEISGNETLFREYVRQSAENSHIKDEEIFGALGQINQNLEQILFAQNEVLKREMSRLSQGQQQILSLLLPPDREAGPRLTPASLAAICNHQVIHSSRQASGQYVSERYVYRLDVESEFRSRFLPSEKPCYLVLGRAGEGKTNIMCHLAELSSPALLFLSGRELTSERSIEDHVLEIILGREAHMSFTALLECTDPILQQNNTFLTVFIDAINDNSDAAALNRAISSFIVSITGTRIKLVVSCRDTDWSHFHDNDVLRQGLFNPVRGSLNLRTLDKASIALFSDNELEAAWSIYKAFYRLEGSLTDELRSLCRDPFMLYLLGEAYSNRESRSDEDVYVLPTSSTRLQMFNKYWERKFPGHRKALQHAVYLLAKNRREQSPSPEFTSFEIIDLLKNLPDHYQIYQSLLSEKILVSTGEESARFTYDLVLEYSSARQYIFQEHALDRKTDSQTIGLLRQYLSQDLALGYGSFLNVLSFILEILVIDNGRSALFSALFGSELRDQFLVPLCSVIEQLPSIEEPEIFKVLEFIARDRKPSDIQFVLARTLGGVRKKKSKLLAIKLLANLAESREDLIRFEVLDTLERLGPRLPDEALEVLIKLIDDAESESIRPSARRLLWRAFFELEGSEQDRILARFSQSSSEYLRAKTRKFIALNDPATQIDDLIRLTNDADAEVRERASQIFWERAGRLSEAELLDWLPQILEAARGHPQKELRQYIREFLNSLIADSRCTRLLPLLEQGNSESREIIRDVLAQLRFEKPSIDFLLLKLQSYAPYPVVSIVRQAHAFAMSHYADRDLYPGVRILDFLFKAATRIIDLQLDPQLVVATFLLGDLEPWELNQIKDDILGQFNEEIFRILVGAANLNLLESMTLEDQEHGMIEEMSLALADDLRSLQMVLVWRLIRLSHSGETGDREIRVRANRALKLYALLAARLELTKIKEELDDQAFAVLQPEASQRSRDLLAKADKQWEININEMVNQLRALPKTEVSFEFIERRLNAYSLHQNLKADPSANIADYYTAILVTDSVANCYKILGLIHTHFRPVREFGDFINKPLEGGYQSLHTAVIGYSRQRMRFLVRTQEMHRQALVNFDYRFREGAILAPYKRPRDERYQQRIWQSVYVFTAGETGGILRLPRGATPIDFAYYVHTELGHRCRGAKINGKICPLNLELQNGDTIEILPAKRGGPSLDWLNPSLGLVKTSRARSKIRAWFKKQEDEQSVVQGRVMLERELQRLGITNLNLEKLARELGFRLADEMFIALANGSLPLAKAIKQVSEIQEAVDILTATVSAQKIKSATDAVDMVGLKGLRSTMARCCNPMPGDAIVGYITRGHGATIHRQDCPNILRRKDTERLLRVDWGSKVRQTFPIPITIKAYDRQGLLGDISTIMQAENVNITDISVNTNRTMIDIKLIIEPRDSAQLSRVLARLESLANVIEAQRIKPG